MSDVTKLLNAVAAGDESAAKQLLPIVYDELRGIARAKLAREKVGQTLQATALVHEAYLRLIGKEDVEWGNTRHFFGAAAEAMRRILIDRARRRNSARHGGDLDRVELNSELLEVSRDEKLLVLNDAIEVLERSQPRRARVVKLRFFAGLSNRETAAALDISEATVERDWVFARAWLRKKLR